MEDDGSELEGPVYDESALDVFGGGGLVVKGEEVSETMDEVGFRFDIDTGDVGRIGGVGIFARVDRNLEDIGHLFDETSAVPFAEKFHAGDFAVAFEDLGEGFVLVFAGTEVFFEGFVGLAVDAGVAYDEPLVEPLSGSGVALTGREEADVVVAVAETGGPGVLVVVAFVAF